MERADAIELDAADPLLGFRDEFVIADPSVIYLDGNSLGRLPKRTIAAVRSVMEREWGAGLVRSWHEWIGMSAGTGDLLAPLLGAAPGETLVVDQTSINLFKLADAALEHTGRGDIVTDTTNFPSDRYVLGAVASRHGGTLRTVDADPVAGPDPDAVAAALDERVGLVSLSHIGFKSGTIADMAGISAATHRAGALVLWDLSHSVGAVPIDLGESDADLAVGCTYKHLNGGPGAPAFLWVRGDLQERLRPTIPGWFGHRDMFAFAGDYTPAAGVGRFAVGTPPILSLTAARCGIELTLEAGIAPIRTKSRSLTALIIDRFDQRLAPLGFTLGSMRDAERRGGHVAVRHPAGYRMSRAMIERGVIPDFRTPDTIRIGAAPLYTSFGDVWDGVEALAEIAESGEHLSHSPVRSGVT